MGNPCYGLPIPCMVCRKRPSKPLKCQAFSNMGVFDNMQIVIEADKLMLDNLAVHRNNGYYKEYADDQLAGFAFENCDTSRKLYN